MRSISWLGVAGLKIETDSGWILIDPYLSRHSKLDMIFKPLLPKARIIESFIDGHPNIEAIFVSHTHSDHAADIPEFAKRTNAKICGSKSLRNILKTFSADKNFLDLEENSIVAGNGWRVTAILSKHGKAILGREPFPGEITIFPKKPRVYHYRTGKVFNFLIETRSISILHLGSAELNDNNLSKALAKPIDIAFFCIPGWNKGQALERFLKVARPKTLIPFHYDPFWKRLRPENVKAIPGYDLDGFQATARKLSPGTKIVTINPLEAIDISKLLEERNELKR